MCVLETEAGSSGRAVIVLHCEDISPDPELLLITLFLVYQDRAVVLSPKACGISISICFLLKSHGPACYLQIQNLWLEFSRVSS